MVKHTQTTRRLLSTNCLKVFDHFVRLALEGKVMQIEKELINDRLFLSKVLWKFRTPTIYSFAEM